MKTNNRIREERVKRKWTQGELALLLNKYGGVRVDPSTVGRHERGTRAINEIYARAYLVAFDLPLEVLFPKEAA